ncbi:hypothetical protein RQP46_003775 [Phenoliferia psychrophenolica]
MRLSCAAALTGALLTNPVQAFFTVVQERADPIISPGAVAGHVHTIMGGSGVSPNSTYLELQRSECTSCDANADMSAYWIPPLYFQWMNGSFSPVEQTSTTIFFTGRTNASDVTGLTAFPEGFRMLAGSPNLREFNSSDLQANAIGWHCFGGGGYTPWIPSQDCPGGLSSEVRFPSCWNGKDLYLPDQAHVAYPDYNKNGSCPSTHSTRLVELFYAIHWNVSNWNQLRPMAMNATQPFVTSNGDPLGYGLHGDFQNGWKADILQSAIDTCLIPETPNVLDKCSVLERTERPLGQFCRKTPDIDEDVTGTLETLPGCNPVTYEASDIPHSCHLPTPAFVPAKVYYGSGAPHKFNAALYREIIPSFGSHAQEHHMLSSPPRTKKIVHRRGRVAPAPHAFDVGRGQSTGPAVTLSDDLVMQ